MRYLILALLLAFTPGCLAAAVGGAFYLAGKGKEKDAAQSAARLDYVQKRRAAGATDEQILKEIRLTDPEWAEEIDERGGSLIEIKAG